MLKLLTTRKMSKDAFFSFFFFKHTCTRKRRVPLQTSLFSNFFFCAFRHSGIGSKLRDERRKHKNWTSPKSHRKEQLCATKTKTKKEAESTFDVQTTWMKRRIRATSRTAMMSVFSVYDASYSFLTKYTNTSRLKTAEESEKLSTDSVETSIFILLLTKYATKVPLL